MTTIDTAKKPDTPAEHEERIRNVLEMVRGLREQKLRSPGLSAAPFSDKGWAIIEDALVSAIGTGAKNER